MTPNRWVVLAFFLGLWLRAGVPAGQGADLPWPGSPACLADWRWLARPPEGERHVVAHLPGRPRLPEGEGGFLLLDARGPGVLDHLLVADGKATLTLWADGRRLWSGTMDDAIQAAEDAAARAAGPPGCLFPAPLAFGGGPLRHLIAPVGFAESLHIVTDQATLPHFLSYRTLEPGAKVRPASADVQGAYAQELRAAAEILRTGATFPAGAYPQAQQTQHEFVLQAASRQTVLDVAGSGELVHVEIHASPALSGSLREVVVELRCDGAAEPAVRLPLPELAGIPHPWIGHRWHTYNGTLAAGLQYPWSVNKPRFHFPENTFHFNLPVPFAQGLRLDLLNRGEKLRFTGSVRASVLPLSERDAQACGHLCATRAVCPVTVGGDPQPLLRLPGPGNLVGLGLFTTGGDRYPPAVRNCVLALVRDSRPPILGQGVAPLWFMGAYGGPVGNRPIWNHPLYDDQFGGVMRHFITDPLPFAHDAVFRFAPGEDGQGAPTEATALAFWYRFGTEPFAAPSLPDRAEPLPHSTFAAVAARKDSRRYWEEEAEDLVSTAGVQGGEVRAEGDVDHNYHPSAGRYLHYVADRAGDWLDCVVPFPPARYFAVGTAALWGPNRGTFEMNVLSRQQAQSPPEFPQGDAFYLGRVLGHVPMQAPVFVGQDLRSLRDTGTEYPLPFLNPSPDQDGVVRFICQAKPQDSSAYLLKLDKLRVDVPPTASGWREFEDLADAETSGDLTAWRPRQGRWEWSAWGAVTIASSPGGRALFRALAATGRNPISEIVLRGSLAPQQGAWQAHILQPGESTPAAKRLVPGKDEQELVEWRIPATGMRLPGTVLLEVTCLGAGQATDASRPPPRAQLALDAWAAK